MCTYCMSNNATADVGQPTDGNLLMVNNAGSASLRCRPRPLRGLALSRAHRACPRAVAAATPERVRATMTSKSSSRTPSRRGMLGGPRRMTLCCALVMERSGQISPFLYAYSVTLPTAEPGGEVTAGHHPFMDCRIDTTCPQNAMTVSRGFE